MYSFVCTVPYLCMYVQQQYICIANNIQLAKTIGTYIIYKSLSTPGGNESDLPVKVKYFPCLCICVFIRILCQ